MTRRLAHTKEPLYSVGEVVAISERYKDICPEDAPEATYLKDRAGWKNKMFVVAELMPHHIRITSVKSEHLQDITDEDCMKEGIKWWTKDNTLFKYDLADGFEMFKWCDKPHSPREAFAALIDKISGNGAWESNPEVWVYEFELID